MDTMKCNCNLGNSFSHQDDIIMSTIAQEIEDDDDEVKLIKMTSCVWFNAIFCH